MRFYTKQHRYYCGIDLHARTMYLCILNQEGEIVLHRNMACSPQSFIKAIAPYREEMAVAVECIFTWYWLADLCAKENIPFVLGHALYMKAIHGGKAKNDKIDAHKIAVLLRGGMIPMAYVYPAEMRSTRDLLRRRMHLMHKRSELLVHIQNTNSQYCLPEFGKKIAYKKNRQRVCWQTLRLLGSQDRQCASEVGLLGGLGAFSQSQPQRTKIRGKTFIQTRQGQSSIHPRSQIGTGRLFHAAKREGF